MQGTIVKGIAGFYYVKAGDRLYQCKARGIFRKQGIIPFVGDHVLLSDITGSDAIVDSILPRKNEFIRPPVANVELLVIVVSVKMPTPNLTILDKFLVMAEQHQTDIAVCFHKVDLAEPGQIEGLSDIYRPLYPVVLTSRVTGQGIEDLKMLLKGKTAAFAGPSGVGKSTLVNLLSDREAAETGEIGEKSKRGKHTTRHVELFEPGYGGMLFDTPGFTSFEILEASEERLAGYYPEMQPYIGQCRYDDCKHLSEPSCAVRDAVKQKIISETRYRSYCDQMKEIRETRKY